MTERELIEQLAAKEHASWARWMDFLFDRSIRNEDGSVTIPSDLAARWRRLAKTPYSHLTEKERESDRSEVMHILPLIHEFARSSGIAAEAAWQELLKSAHWYREETWIPPAPFETVLREELDEFLKNRPFAPGEAIQQQKTTGETPE